MQHTSSSDIVDIKPVNMEELTEVITATEFHPQHCNQFMYSSSKSNIKLADMRESALCDRHAKCEFTPVFCDVTSLFTHHILLFSRLRGRRRRVDALLLLRDHLLDF